MAPGVNDPRMPSVKPRVRYNTIAGINGPLVILDNVRFHGLGFGRLGADMHTDLGQVPTIQRNRFARIA